MKIKFHIFHNLCFLLLLSSLNCHFLLLVFLSFYKNGPQLEIDKVVFLVVLFAPQNRLTLTGTGVSRSQPCAGRCDTGGSVALGTRTSSSSDQINTHNQGGREWLSSESAIVYSLPPAFRPAQAGTNIYFLGVVLWFTLIATAMSPLLIHLNMQICSDMISHLVVHFIKLNFDVDAQTINNIKLEQTHTQTQHLN